MAVRVLVVGYLAIQLLLPAVLLVGPRPARFGWQMYSTAADLPTVVAVDASGHERTVDVASLLAGPRAEVDYVPLLVDQGCRLVEAETLLIQPPGTDPEAIEVRCP